MQLYNITHRSVSGVEYITTLWMTPLSVKVLPDGFPKETHSGFNISSSGHLVSNGLDLEDSDTYHFSTAAYDGLLTVTIVVNGMLVCVSAASGECSSLYSSRVCTGTSTRY